MIFHPWCCQSVFASNNSVPVLTPWRKFEQSMLTVLSLDALTGGDRTREQWIYWFIYCIAQLPHRSFINMHFLFQLFTFTDITDCLYSHLCVFNINLCVFDSLSAIRHEGELSLVLMCCVVTAAFCVYATDVCAQKTVYQKFNLMPLFHCVVRLGTARFTFAV